jgi:hypothetical protein
LPVTEYVRLPADYESIFGGNAMLYFVIGLVVGSFTMLFVMSLMAAAKRGDKQFNNAL